MGALINVSLRVDKLPKEKFVSGKDGADGWRSPRGDGLSHAG